MYSCENIISYKYFRIMLMVTLLKEEIVHLEDEVHRAISENSFIVLPER